jgi:hypothetical protein
LSRRNPIRSIGFAWDRRASVSRCKLAFVNQPVEVAQFRPELAALIGTPGRRPDIVMRFGLLMLAEIGFDIVLAGRTMVEHFAMYRQPSYAAGLTGQIAFAVIRFLQWQRSVLAPEQR